MDQGCGAGRDQTFQGPVTYGPSPEHVEQFLRPLTGQLVAKDSQIAALTDQIATMTNLLWEMAVKSIAEGAAEGDSRLEKALDLLNANKIREALALLEAFAEDKEARVDKDSKEAAIAYSNFGMIAGFVDLKLALEAFEKALALDPDEMPSLLMAGYIQINEGDLDKAQARLERLMMLPESGDQGFYQGCSTLYTEVH